jgi:hypothetical protein
MADQSLTHLALAGTPLPEGISDPIGLDPLSRGVARSAGVCPLFG